ncbi:MAG: TlpA disulfide reductase family protein [Vicinamibacterales bacterium]|nr:TlpA disulfide reductase family protein [Vicinamibacterales bacterium]
MAPHDDPEVERWVDDRMATLGPNPERQPNVESGLAQLTARRGTDRARRPLGTWLVAVAAMLWLGVLLFPVERLWQTGTPDRADAEPSARDSTAVVAAVNAADAGSGVSMDARRRAREPRLIPVAQRESAPDFILPDMSGSDATLSDYTGQVLLLNFWATWCQPCRAEMPWFVAFQDVFEDRGFAVLGVSVDEPGWDVVRPFLEQRPVNYRIALADTIDRQAPFGPINIRPTTWLVDRTGRVATVHVGLVDRSTIVLEIRQLLDEAS